MGLRLWHAGVLHDTVGMIPLGLHRLRDPGTSIRSDYGLYSSLWWPAIKSSPPAAPASSGISLAPGRLLLPFIVLFASVTFLCRDNAEATQIPPLNCIPRLRRGSRVQYALAVPFGLNNNCLSLHNT